MKVHFSTIFSFDWNGYVFTIPYKSEINILLFSSFNLSLIVKDIVLKLVFIKWPFWLRHLKELHCWQTTFFILPVIEIEPTNFLHYVSLPSTRKCFEFNFKLLVAAPGWYLTNSFSRRTYQTDHTLQPSYHADSSLIYVTFRLLKRNLFFVFFVMFRNHLLIYTSFIFFFF